MSKSPLIEEPENAAINITSTPFTHYCVCCGYFSRAPHFNATALHLRTDFSCCRRFHRAEERNENGLWDILSTTSRQNTHRRSVKKSLLAFECLILLVTGSTCGSTPSVLSQSVSKREVLTNAGVVALSKRGFSDSAIIQKIRCYETSFNTSPEELKLLRRKGVSEAVIREIDNQQKRTIINSGESSAAQGSVAPQGSTTRVKSEPDQLTPSQRKAQEEATTRANPSVPILPGTTERVPDVRNRSREPVTTPVATFPRTRTGSLRNPHKQRKKGRKKTHRKQGDPS